MTDHDPPCAYAWHRPYDWERPATAGKGYCCGLCNPDPRVLRREWLAQQKQGAQPVRLEADGLPPLDDDRAVGAWLAGLGRKDDGR